MDILEAIVIGRIVVGNVESWKELFGSISDGTEPIVYRKEDIQKYDDCICAAVKKLVAAHLVLEGMGKE